MHRGPGAAGAAPVLAAGPLKACGDHGELQCGRISVPLDPSGQVPGRVELSVKRFSPVAHPTGTVIALAGGPGQSSIQVLPLFISALQPALGHRALVVFDGRGIGRSEPLECRTTFAQLSVPGLLGRCALRLEPGSRFYATTDTVSDIETVRRALSIGRFALYGVSYGTLGALDYARAYPEHVDHLILDSVVPPTGEQPFATSSFAAMRRTLAGACASACPGLSPLADLTTLLAPGSHRDSGLIAGAVTEAMFNGDFAPQLRSAVPALLHLAVAGDADAARRLNDLQFAAYVAENASGTNVASGPWRGINIEPAATLCEDMRLPWAPRDPAAVRQAKLRHALDAVPESAIAPFNHATLLENSSGAACADWPTSGDAPATIAAPMPDTPTLILSGEQDVRTPLADATALAAQLPHATLLAVPNVGHAVLTNDLSGCAARGLARLHRRRRGPAMSGGGAAAGGPAAPRLGGRLAPAGGLSGGAGPALTAVVLTLRHEVGLWQWASVASGLVTGTEGGSIGAAPLRNGYGLHLGGVSYVPGLSIGGDLLDRAPYDTGTISVSEGRGAIGTLALRGDGSIAGHIEGQPVNLTAADREAVVDANGLGPDSTLLDPADPARRPRA